jgi:xanthine dehydrogenase YagT iron-sulfur-binding subunit
MADADPKPTEQGTGLSRRDFLKLSGISVAVPMVVGPRVLEVAGGEVEVHGPGKTPVTLLVNGNKCSADLEPRVTLLDALRDHFDLTGAKRVCDRGECGACTVLLEGRPVYACAMLAVDAQGRSITTVEGLTLPGKLHPVQQAFLDHDAQQCGFCTPGFVVASQALLDRYPHPTSEQIQRGLSGNFCRCGTYYGLRGALTAMSRKGA